MRFLLFNIVVAGALVFLFTSDREELHAAADRAHDAASEVKSKAFEVIGGKTVTPRKTPEAPPAAKPAIPAKLPVKSVETRAAAAAPAEAEETFSQNKPLAPAAADAVREVQVATRQLVAPAPAKVQTGKALIVKELPPEVAQRREEVLAEGIVGDPVSEAQKFMPPSTRKRDLMLLSEEMELFSARAISR